MKKRKTTYWRICIAIVVMLILITFTPLIIPHGVYKPMLLGIPYSLWSSFLITCVLVALTYLGSKVHPGKDEEEEQL
jgi:hypothetical protein